MMATMIGLIQVGITLLRLGDLSRYVSHAVIVGFTLGALGAAGAGSAEKRPGAAGQGRPARPFSQPTLADVDRRRPTSLADRGCGRGDDRPGAVASSAAAPLETGDSRTADGPGRHVGCGGPLGSGRRLTGVKLIPEIPRSLPHFQVPSYDFGLMHQLAGSATAIALLGLLEAIAMAKSIAARTGEKLDINQQCLSEGLANLAGSFFRCFPGSGSLTRSYINHQAGAATQWSGVISALGVAATILVAAPYAQYIPRAALAGILIFSALRMVDQHQLTYHLRATRFDALIVISTALAAVMVSVEFCILIGVLMSFMFYVPRAARTEMSVLTLAPGNVVRPQLPDDLLCSRLRIYNLEGEWFFGSAPDVEKLLEQIEAETVGTVRTVLLRVKHVRNADGVCMHLFDEFLQRMARGGTRVVLCGVREDFLKVLRDSGVADRLPRECIYPETSQVWTSTMLAIQDAYRRSGRRPVFALPSPGGRWSRAVRVVLFNLTDDARRSPVPC